MKNPTFVRWTSAVMLGSALLLGACRDNPLDVANPNQPDIDRAFATAALTEAVVSKLFQQMFQGQYAVGGDNTWAPALVLAFESASALGNFGFGARSAIPRPPIDNSLGNANQSGNFRDYDHLSRNARSAANAIRRLREFNDGGVGLSAGANARAMSFSYFALGYGLGHISLMYDSAGVITPEFSADSVPPLTDYKDVNAHALRLLDSALAYAGGATATAGQVTAANAAGGFPIPVTWWSGPAAISRADWVRVINSFKARIRAGVARTPAERDAVDWPAVIANANAGITANLIVTADAAAGWNQQTLVQLRTSTTWSQMSPFYLGMGDTAGSYEAWLQTSVNTADRQIAGSTWLMRTPDRRFPAGATRAAQQTASGGTAKTGPPAATPWLYFRNRPEGDDDPGQTWGTWQYDNHRFWGIGAAGGNGPWVIFSVVENDMLAAEGYLRTNQPNLAIPLINKSRGPSGLGDIPLNSTHIPAGTGCVPRVPQPPTYTVTACGTLMEAMKWEKRLETAFTGYAQWFIDARGWGDLYAGTPLEWPVPYQETFARYGTGSYYVNSRVAAVGTYGFGKDPNF